MGTSKQPAWLEQGVRGEEEAGRAEPVADGQSCGSCRPGLALALTLSAVGSLCRVRSGAVTSPQPSQECHPSLRRSACLGSGEAGGGSDRAAGFLWLPGTSRQCGFITFFELRAVLLLSHWDCRRVEGSSRIFLVKAAEWGCRWPCEPWAPRPGAGCLLGCSALRRVLVCSYWKLGEQ